MILFNAVHFAQLGDAYVWMIGAADFWFLVAATLALGVAAVWLARRPQPVPSGAAWARHKYNADVRAAMKRHPSGKHR